MQRTASDISTRPRSAGKQPSPSGSSIWSPFCESTLVWTAARPDPVVLEFDHLRDKKFGIGNGLRDRAWQRVLNEMAKCDVVCANCHGRRTAKRGGFARAVVAQR
jgi:hypothetical protein